MVAAEREAPWDDLAELLTTRRASPFQWPSPSSRASNIKPRAAGPSGHIPTSSITTRSIRAATSRPGTAAVVLRRGSRRLQVRALEGRLRPSAHPLCGRGHAARPRGLRCDERFQAHASGFHAREHSGLRVALCARRSTRDLRFRSSDPIAVQTPVVRKADHIGPAADRRGRPQAGRAMCDEAFRRRSHDYRTAGRSAPRDALGAAGGDAGSS